MKEQVVLINLKNAFEIHQRSYPEFNESNLPTESQPVVIEIPDGISKNDYITRIFSELNLIVPPVNFDINEPEDKIYIFGEYWLYIKRAIYNITISGYTASSYISGHSFKTLFKDLFDEAKAICQQNEQQSNEAVSISDERSSVCLLANTASLLDEDFPNDNIFTPGVNLHKFMVQQLDRYLLMNFQHAIPETLHDFLILNFNGISKKEFMKKLNISFGLRLRYNHRRLHEPESELHIKGKSLNILFNTLVDKVKALRLEREQNSNDSVRSSIESNNIRLPSVIATPSVAPPPAPMARRTGITEVIEPHISSAVVEQILPPPEVSEPKKSKSFTDFFLKLQRERNALFKDIMKELNIYFNEKESNSNESLLPSTESIDVTLSMVVAAPSVASTPVNREAKVGDSRESNNSTAEGSKVLPPVMPLTNLSQTELAAKYCLVNSININKRNRLDSEGKSIVRKVVFNVNTDSEGSAVELRRKNRV